MFYICSEMRYLDLDEYLWKNYLLVGSYCTNCEVLGYRYWGINKGYTQSRTQHIQSVCVWGDEMCEWEGEETGGNVWEREHHKPLFLPVWPSVMLMCYSWFLLYFLGFKAILWLHMHSNYLHLKGGGGIPEQLPIRVKLINIEGGPFALLSCSTVGFYIYCWFP